MAANKETLQNGILVSVIVPAYNSADYIEKCLDSLIAQTLKEIEIIVVNNGSNDATGEILESYHQNYSEIISIYNIEHHETAGFGRNFGIKKAKGEYIAFCDSDDYYEPYAMKTWVAKAIECNFDLVQIPFYILEDDRKQIACTLETKGALSLEELYLNGHPTFWTKLVHRDILIKAGDIPFSLLYDDLSYIPLMMQYVKKPGYLDKPLYIHWRRQDSYAKGMSVQLSEQELAAYDYLLENVLPQFKDLIAAFIAKRIKLRLDANRTNSDVYIAYLKRIKNCLIENDYYERHVHTLCKKYMDLPDVPMDQNIFLNGFNKELDKNRIHEIEKIAFNSKCEVYVLNEENCDIKSNETIKKAYERQDYDFLGAYFAVEKIYVNGGVYLSDRIRIKNPLNNVRYHQAFFSYLDYESFSEYIFGGIKGNGVFKLIRYELEKKNSIAECIKTVLHDQLNIPLDGRTNLFQYAAALYNPETFVCNKKRSPYFGSLKYMSEHDFSDKPKDGAYLVVKRTTLNSLGASDEEVYLNLKNKYINIRKALLDDRKTIKKLKENVQYLQRKLLKTTGKLEETLEENERLENVIIAREAEVTQAHMKVEGILKSTSWRITLPLRWIAKKIRLAGRKNS